MRLLWVLALAACAAPPPQPARAWPAEAFFGEEERDFGGFLTTRLAAGDKDDGGVLLVQPAYARGKPAAYVITEIWQAHPDVWVQPVYAVPPQLETLFGVGTDSTFYSPFWRAHVVHADTDGPFTNIDQLTNFRMQTGPLIVCPIVPAGVRQSSLVHPVLADAGLRDARDGGAYVNGKSVGYLDYGVDWQVTDDDDRPLQPANLYVFTVPSEDGGRRVLDYPAVLSDDARHHAYVRRTDVPLGSAAGAFFMDAGHAVDPEQARWHEGRVARDKKCFENVAAFPAGCDWLDSEAAIRAKLLSHQIIETNVTLTANPVLLP